MIPTKLILQGLAAVMLLAAISYGVHTFLEYEREIGRKEVRAEYATKLQEAKEAAAKIETELRTAKDLAVEKGNNREQVIKSLSTASIASSNSLQHATDSIRNSVPSASVEALRQSTSTLSALLTDCQGKYREMAETADRHANDSETLSNAWPVAPAK